MSLGEHLMERMLASPADAGNILKLYELRTEPVLRQARAWMAGSFWPEVASDYFRILDNPADPHNAYLRQVISYWEMAAALVLHGAISAELFVDCNAEGFFLLAKLAHILPEIRERQPHLLKKTSELVERFTIAAAKYDSMLKNVEARRKGIEAKAEAQEQYSSAARS
jgi:hypothetical protein